MGDHHCRAPMPPSPHVAEETNQGFFAAQARSCCRGVLPVTISSLPLLPRMEEAWRIITTSCSNAGLPSPSRNRGQRREPLSSLLARGDCLSILAGAGKMKVHSCCSLDCHTTPSLPPSAASPLQEKGDAGNGSRRPESSTVVAVLVIRA
nr:hypothetical protein Iba_chr10cCG9960 [Ipomoea batatas]